MPAHASNQAQLESYGTKAFASFSYDTWDDNKLGETVVNESAAGGSGDNTNEEDF